MFKKPLSSRWAKKLARSKFYVVLTDKESVVYLQGADPKSFTDVLMLEAQAAEISLFIERLVELEQAHLKAKSKLLQPTKPRRKIEVK